MYISNFFDFLIKKVKNKRVLDCGAAGEEGIGKESPYWIHRIISENSSYVLGFDLEKEAVSELRKKGYNIIFGDCEEMDLEGVNEKFDIVFAGEIIEHLTRLGNFLEGTKKYLKDDGVLIITTPNAFSLYRFFGNMLGANRENPQHVSVQNQETLVQSLERHNYEVLETHFFINPAFYDHKRLKNVRKLGKIITHPIFKIKPQLGHQIVVIAKMK